MSIEKGRRCTSSLREEADAGSFLTLRSKRSVRIDVTVCRSLFSKRSWLHCSRMRASSASIWPRMSRRIAFWPRVKSPNWRRWWNHPEYRYCCRQSALQSDSLSFLNTVLCLLGKRASSRSEEAQDQGEARVAEETRRFGLRRPQG